ncbi:hypothetical protein Hanom_Chr09g00774531 [Helianthus anomalus]
MSNDCSTIVCFMKLSNFEVRIRISKRVGFRYFFCGCYSCLLKIDRPSRRVFHKQVFRLPMSWFNNYLSREYSNESFVLDSYDGTTIPYSYEKPVPSNMQEEEVVSGIHYRDNSVQQDLNILVEDSYPHLFELQITR